MTRSSDCYSITSPVMVDYDGNCAILLFMINNYYLSYVLVTVWLSVSRWAIAKMICWTNFHIS